MRKPKMTGKGSSKGTTVKTTMAPPFGKRTMGKRGGR
jgi:hypothetical protein